MGALDGLNRFDDVWWYTRPKLFAGETVRWSAPATREQSRLRGVSGKLFLTGDRLLFQPNRLEWAMGARRWECWLVRMAEVGREGRGANPLSGSFRTRLRIEDNQGTVDRFTVEHLDQVIARIDSARLGDSQGGAG